MKFYEVQALFRVVLAGGRVWQLEPQAVNAACRVFVNILLAGRVTAQDLRAGLADYMPGAYPLAARAMGMTGEQFAQVIEYGLALEPFLQRFTWLMGEELRRLGEPV